MQRRDKEQITVLLSGGENQRFCAYCQSRGFKKSTLIAHLIREHLDREGFAAQSDLFERAGEDEEGVLARPNPVASRRPRG